MEKHRQDGRPAKEQGADRKYGGVGEKVDIALKANLDDSAEKPQSRQEEIDRQAVERAENEGMTRSPKTDKHPARVKETRHGRHLHRLDVGNRTGAADVKKRGS